MAGIACQLADSCSLRPFAYHFNLLLAAHPQPIRSLFAQSVINMRQSLC